VKINLQGVVSIPGFIGCVHDAMAGHPVKHLRRAAQRQIGAMEKEIGFDIKVIKGSVTALMSSGANHVSLLFTGSIRNALKMMLEDSHQPVFGQAVRTQLPTIDRVDVIEYLDFQFDTTGKPAEEQALEHLLNLTREAAAEVGLLAQRRK
jgi:hypothetical protein